MQNISFIKIVIRRIVFCLIYFGFIQSAFADHFSSTTVENFLGIPKLHSPKNSFSPNDGSFTIQSTAQDLSRMNLFIDIKGIDAESRTYHWVSSVYAVKPDESTYTPITFNTSHASHNAYSMTFSPDGTFYRAVADISTWKTGTYTIYFSLDNGYNQQLSDIFIDRTISTRNPNGYGCPIPDFAEIACFDNTKEIDCPASNHSLYGQDGTYLINKASYIKMDTNGHDLPDHASSWSMVRDTVTGLIWEIKQMADGAMDYSNPTDGDNVYTWYDPDNPLNTGVENNQRNTNVFINQLNQIQWGGFNHWRMPTIQELETLINHSETEPAIAQEFTPTQKNQYWSSTTAAYAMMARGIDFNNGNNNLYQKSSQFYVRAVVGPTCQRRFVDNDETITDTCTGLVWEKHASDSIYSWENSLEFCNNKETAGFSDWRLPSKQELRTIIDYLSKNPAIDTTLFKNQKADQYWTSTSNIASQNQAWAVNFQFAEDISDSKTTPKYVRAVRGGQPQDQNKLFIHSPALASQWFVGDKMAIQWETQSIEGYVNIYLSLMGGANHTFDLIATTANDGQHNWIVSGQGSDNAVIKIEPVASPELSSQLGMFSIDLPKQIFYLSPSSVTLALNDPVALTLVYDTNDNNKTFGAGIRFHYNANILAFTGFSYTLNEHLIETRPPEPDTDNYDNDDSTDTFVYLKWQHIYPDWPISPMPLNLAILNFVTIESGTSPVNMSTQFAETAYTQITHNAHIISKNQPPDIQIQSIVQRTDGSGFLDIVFMGKDAENDIVHWDLEKCGYALDGSNNFSSIVFQSPVDYMAFSETDSMYTAVINASDWDDGVYQIKLAVDNEHVPTTYSPVHVDNTPPDITVDCGEGPGKSCLKEDNAFSLHGNCSDDTESIIINQSGQSIDWLPDGDEWFYPVSLASIPEHAYTSVTYSYTIVAYDRFGNRGVSDVIHVKRIPKNEITISQIDPLVLPENTAQQRIIVSISSNIAGSMDISCDYPPQSIIADIELSNKTLTFQASETIDLTLTIVPVNGRFGSETVTLVCKDKYDRSDSMSFPIEIIEGNWWFREYNFQWVDICTISKNNVFAIDRNGAIYQFNGQFWKPLRVEDYEPLTAIWGDNNDVYAVGDNGYIIHYNGMEWSAMAGNTTEHLRDIWGTGTGYLYAVSSEGTIFKYDNSQWEKAFETQSFPLTAIWGSSSTNIYAVGNGGTIVHFDNTQWHFIESPTNEHLTNIWGSQKDNVYAIGENGTIIHYDGHNWSIENSPSASTLTGIWGVDETTVFAVGYSGTILQKTTDQWQEMPQQSENLNAISGTDANHIIVAGDHGMMLSFENNQWTQTASPLTAWSQMTHVTQMTAIWGISDMCIFASGLYQDDSVIFQYNGQQWERSIINDSRIVSIWGSSKQDVFAVADNGQIFHYDGHNWSVQETDFHLNAVWGASPSDVFAVGHGIILNFDGHSWKQMLNEQSHTLNAIWGRSYQDIYAVGNNGVILHYNGTDWQAMTNTDGSDLLTIQGNNTQVYAGGKNGILSYENQTWVAVDINFHDTIIDMSPTGEGEWFVIGSNTIWQYSPEDSQFSTIYNSDDLVMRAIWGSLSVNRYIIADNGIILHHKENKAPESPNQKHFLQALYTQTLGNQWTVSPLWQISESECAWSGITCNASQQIISIDLNQKNLAGKLPQSIDLIPNIEYLFLQGNALHGSVPAQIKSLTDLADNQSDFRYNALYTDDPEIRTFLNQKQIDGSWENTQTIAPSNISAQAGYRAITLTWNPIAYSWDDGYYEIFYRLKSNASLPYSTVTTMDKTVSSVSLPDLSSDTDFEIRMRSVTKKHANNPNDLFSHFSELLEISTLNTPTSLTITSITQRNDASGYLDIEFTGIDPETNTAGFVLDECVRLTPSMHLTFVDMAYTQMTFDNNGNAYTAVVDASDWESKTYQIKLVIENAIPGISQLFTVDNTPPAIPTISTGSGMDYTTVMATQVLTGTFDMDTNIITITINGQDDIVQLNANGTWIYTATFDVVGQYAFSIQSIDLWGNESQTSDITITYEAPIISSGERKALIELYRQTTGDHWTHNDHWQGEGTEPDGTECTWYGISCNQTKERVIAIDLPENNLAGSIPKAISLLTHLQTLNIKGNRLIGEVPESIQNLASLKVNQSDFRFNGLTSQLSDVTAFMNARQIGGKWTHTQTITPENFRVSTIEFDRIALSWDPIAYTSNGHYEIKISSDIQGPFETIQIVDKTESTYTATGLESDTQYYFTIHTNSLAHDQNPSDWQSQSNSVQARTDNLPPTEPSNNSPENNSENIAITPNLSWDCTDSNPLDILTYTLYLDTRSILSTPLVSNITRLNYQITTPLQYSSRYYWRIDATDNHGAVTQGPIWQFRTIANMPSELTINTIQQLSDGSGRIKIVLTGTDLENDSVSFKPDECLFYEAASPLSYTMLVFETSHMAHTAHDPMIFSSTGTQYTAIVDASDWKSGNYFIQLAVTGANTTQNSDVFSVDHIPPAPPVITTNGGNNYTTTSNGFIINGTFDTDTHKVMLGDFECSRHIQTWSYQNILKDGDNHYSFYAVDSAGNVSEPASITITYVKYQIVKLLPSIQTVNHDQSITLTAYYSTSNQDTTSGIGLRFHYASNALIFEKFSHVYETGLITNPLIYDDLEDFDNDISTDKYLTTGWHDIIGNWQPEKNKLLDMQFQAINVGQTSVNITTSAKASGYLLSSVNAEIISIDTPPEIQILSVDQRTDGSGFVNVLFNGIDAENDTAYWSADQCLYLYQSTAMPLTFVNSSAMIFSPNGTQYTAVINASAWATGQYTITMAVENSNLVSYPFFLDNTPPDPPVITTDGGYGEGMDYTTTAFNVTIEGTCSADTDVLSINNMFVSYSGQNWQQDLPLSDGTNRIDVLATDAYGNSSKTSITITRIYTFFVNIMVSSAPKIGGGIQVQVNGSDIPLPYTLSYGTSVDISAMPNNNYTLVKWQGNMNLPVDKKLTLSAKQDIEITAIFNRAPYKPEIKSIAIENMAVTITTDTFTDLDVADKLLSTKIRIWRDDQSIDNRHAINPLEIDMPAGTSTVIPESALSEGLKYRFQMGYQDSGSKMITWSNDKTFITGIPKKIIASHIKPGIEITEYEMVSFTQWPSTPQATSLFGHLGVYEEDFRIGTYEPQIGNYIEYSNDLIIQPGRAYWILIRNGHELDFTGVPVNKGVDFDVALKYNPHNPDDGWNMIACPNDITYQWGQIQVLQYNDMGNIIVSPISIAKLNTIDDDDLLIEDRICQWNHSETEPYAYHTSLDFKLSPNEGYWVKALKPNVVLRFPKDRLRSMRKADRTERIRHYVYDDPPMPMSDSSFIEVYDAAQGGCFIVTVFHQYSVINSLLVLGGFIFFVIFYKAIGRYPIRVMMLICLISLIFQSGNASATNNATVNATNVNIRVGPSIKARIIGKILEKDELIEIINKKNKWYFIQYDLKKGWIYADFVSPFTQTQEIEPESLDPIIQTDNTLQELSAPGRAYFDLGVFAFEEGEYQNAISNFEKAIGLNPNAPEFHHFMGKAYLETKNYELSEKFLTDAWKMDPSLSDILKDRAMLAYRQSDYQSAGTLFLDLIRMNPSDIMSTYYAANCLYKQKDYYRAGQLFQKASKASPTIQANCLYYAGVCKIKTGFPQKGRQLLARVRDNPKAGTLKEYASRWIAALDKQKTAKKSYFLFAQLGYQYDSNIRLEPVDEDLYTDEDDFCTSILLSGNYAFANTTPWQLSAGMVYFKYLYNDFTQYNMDGTMVHLKTKLVLDPVTIGVKLSPSIFWLDSTKYLERLNINPTFSFKVNPQLTATLSFANKFDNNLDNNDRDARQTDNELTVKYVIPKRNLMLFSTARLELMNADNDINDYYRIVSKAGIRMQKLWGFTLGLTGQYEQKSYQLIDPLYDAIREDFKSMGVLYIQRSILYKWLGFKTEFKFTKNSSNINIFNYDRSTITFSLTANH